MQETENRDDAITPKQKEKKRARQEMQDRNAYEPNQSTATRRLNQPEQPTHPTFTSHSLSLASTHSHSADT